jgi:type II secretory pathway component GspD/PulD (secretin)
MMGFPGGGGVGFGSGALGGGGFGSGFGSFGSSGTSEEREARSFRLKHMAADDVADAITKAVAKLPAFKGKKVAIVPDPRSNSVLVTGDPASVKEMSKMIEKLDQDPRLVPIPTGPVGPGAGPGRASSSGASAGFAPGGGGGAFGPGGGAIKVVSLKHAAAPDLSAVLSRVFPQAEVTPEPRSNKLIIRADDETQLQLAALIQQLDVEGSGR